MLRRPLERFHDDAGTNNACRLNVHGDTERVLTHRHPAPEASGLRLQLPDQNGQQQHGQ